MKPKHLPKVVKDREGNEFIFRYMSNGYPVYMNVNGRGFKHIFEPELKFYTIIEQ